MKKHILILGAGFGGLATANFLRKNLDDICKITVIDKKSWFMMGFVNLWILNGTRTLQESQIPLDGLKRKGIDFVNDQVTGIDYDANTVYTASSGIFAYDYLVISLGAELVPEEVEGFTDRGFDLYNPEQIPKLHDALLSLQKGKIAICIMDLPYKCPPAPFEASMLVNDLLIKNQTRDRIQINLYTPSQIALPVAGPDVSKQVLDLLAGNNIGFNPACKLKSVQDNTIEFDSGNIDNFDLLIGIPPHRVPKVIKNSGLAKGKWICVDRFTLRTSIENVFAIGDVTEIKVTEYASIPKAGIFAERQAKVVAQQIANDITRYKSSSEKFDGRGYCFMEIGDSKAGFIDADFYNQKGPITRLEFPSEKSYEKKILFEKNRISEWLL